MAALSQLDFAAAIAKQCPQHVVIAPITSTRTVRVMSWDEDSRHYRTVLEYLYRPAVGRWCRVA